MKMKKLLPFKMKIIACSFWSIFNELIIDKNLFKIGVFKKRIFAQINQI